MKVLKFEPKSEEWLATRRRYITGTEICSLFGLDHYKSATKVLEEKLTPKPFIDNSAMRRGRILEPGVMIALNEIGIPAKAVDYEQIVMVVDDEAGLSASLDGKAEIEGGFHLVECKTTRIDLFQKWYTEPPLKYLMQVQTQLYVCRKSSCILACLGADLETFPLIVYQVQSNEGIQELIKEEAKRFWQSYKDGIKYKVKSEHKEYIKNNILTGISLIFS